MLAAAAFEGGRDEFFLDLDETEDAVADRGGFGGNSELLPELLDREERRRMREINDALADAFSERIVS